MIIVPSILSDSIPNIRHMVDRLTSETNLRRVQIDIVDPEYSEDLTIHPIDLTEVDLKGVVVDFHLMTNDPINDVIECSQISGARTIIAQIEHMPSQQAYIEHVQSLKLLPGLSLDLYTPVESIETNVIPHLDIIQVMGNKAGKQGQFFLAPQAIEKISELVALRKETSSSFQIAVDIGMTPENAKIVAQAGADMVTPGSYLWNSSDLHIAIEAYS